LEAAAHGQPGALAAAVAEVAVGRKAVQLFWLLHVGCDVAK
jgi:hypothetical protein